MATIDKKDFEIVLNQWELSIKLPKKQCEKSACTLLTQGVGSAHSRSDKYSKRSSHFFSSIDPCLVFYSSFHCMIHTKIPSSLPLMDVCSFPKHGEPFFVSPAARTLHGKGPMLCTLAVYVQDQETV